MDRPGVVGRPEDVCGQLEAKLFVCPEQCAVTAHLPVPSFEGFPAPPSQAAGRPRRPLQRVHPFASPGHSHRTGLTTLTTHLATGRVYGPHGAAKEPQPRPDFPGLADRGPKLWNSNAAVRIDGSVSPRSTSQKRPTLPPTPFDFQSFSKALDSRQRWLRFSEAGNVDGPIKVRKEVPSQRTARRPPTNHRPVGRSARPRG